MWNKVECPYCNEANDTADYLQDLDSDNMLDMECSHCEEEFEVYVEFEPTFSANKIVYEECEKCNKKVRDIKHRGSTFPYPHTFNEDKICKNCWTFGILVDYNNEKIL